MNRPGNVKEQIVEAREFTNIRLVGKEEAAFAYSPTVCRNTYRVVVVRKVLSMEKGQRRLFDDVRHCFYITRDARNSAAEVVLSANGRRRCSDPTADRRRSVRPAHHARRSPFSRKHPA